MSVEKRTRTIKNVVILGAGGRVLALPELQPGAYDLDADESDE
jgi:hypothetical protein